MDWTELKSSEWPKPGEMGGILNLSELMMAVILIVKYTSMRKNRSSHAETIERSILRKSSRWPTVFEKAYPNKTDVFRDFLTFFFVTEM